MLIARQVGAQPGPVEIVPGAGAGVLGVGARQFHLVARLGHGVLVALALRGIGRRADRLGAERDPAAVAHAAGVHRLRLDGEGHAFVGQAAAVVGVIQPLRAHHIHAEMVGQRAAGVDDERPQRDAGQRLLPGDLDAVDHVGGEQRHRAAGRDHLVGNVLEAGDGRVLDADRLDVVLALPDAQQLVEILLVADELGIWLGGEIGEGDMPSVLHRDRRAQARAVALRVEAVGRRRRGHRGLLVR